MRDGRVIKFKVYYEGKFIGFERLTEHGWEWRAIDLDPDPDEHGPRERWTHGVFPYGYAYERRQFIGSFDKNGKEIYQNDILQTLGLHEVVWRNNAWALRRMKDDAIFKWFEGDKEIVEG